MSVIVEDLNKADPVTGSYSIYVLTKGADSIIIPRLTEEFSPHLEATKSYVERYA